MLSPELAVTPEPAILPDLPARIDQLIDILQKEIEVYRELRSALGDEHGVLLSRSFEPLCASNARKETCVLKARLLEEVRSSLVCRIAREIGGEPEEIHISSILPHASRPQRIRLSDCQAELKALMTDVVGRNDRNRHLIDASLRCTTASLQFIAGFLSSGGTYAGTGRMTVEGHNGRLCSRRG